MTQMTAESATTEPPIAEEFAIVEIFGHRRHAGRIIEVERFGAKFLRIDIPRDGDFAKGYDTQMYGGASIFSITPTTLDMVQRINRPYDPPARLTYREPDDERQGEADDDGLGDPDGEPQI